MERRKGYPDLTGQKYQGSRLTILGDGKALQYNFSGYIHYVQTYRCKCDCGEIVDIAKNNLLSGNTRSCGCMRREHGKVLGTNFGGRKKRVAT